jgi:biopolymer transport protein ExbB
MSLFAGIQELFDAGGFAMPPLLGLAFLLWYALGMRLLTLRRGVRLPVRSLVRAYRDGRGPTPTGLVDTAAMNGAAALREHPGGVPRTVLEQLLNPIRVDLERGRVVIRSVVAVAPLLGLLGTVTGMIETFRSLADMALFTQGGGIAGGIAEALLTTQVGLAVSVPGIIVGQVLDRRQQSIEGQLQQMEELLSAGTPQAEEAA